MSRTAAWLLLGALGAAACAERSGAEPSTGAPPAPASASVPRFTRGAATVSPDDGVKPTTAPSGARAAIDSAAPSTSGEPGASAGAEAAEPTGPLPAVDVRNVGMHIGGAENTAEQKRPIREAVQPHYDAFRACYGKIDKPAKEVIFGVDIHIGREGGLSKIGSPRDGGGGRVFNECMVASFGRIEFPRPPRGAPQIVSFSLSFRRK